VIRGSWAAPKQRTTTTGISLIVGGILGLAAALGMTHLIKFTTDGASLPVIQTASVILSFAFALLSGIYPAWSVSRIAPIEALRYEEATLGKFGQSRSRAVEPYKESGRPRPEAQIRNARTPIAAPASPSTIEMIQKARIRERMATLATTMAICIASDA